MMGYNSMATYDGGVWWRDYDEFETELEVHLNKDGNQAVRQPWLSAASWRRRPCWRRCRACCGNRRAAFAPGHLEPEGAGSGAASGPARFGILRNLVGMWGTLFLQDAALSRNPKMVSRE